MATLYSVDPETFVKPASKTPANGRGAWSQVGIDFNYRYALSKDPAQRIGTRAEVSLDHWAVAAGCYAIQLRLVALKYMQPLADSERGIFGPRTDSAVRDFQGLAQDPDGGADLLVDGIVGRSDARALFTPLIMVAEEKYDIPEGLLIGETNRESAVDPGALGYFIYYPDYRGVDRGMSQINSSSNQQVAWLQAFNPTFALDWSAKRMRGFYDQYTSRYPKQPSSTLWDAAICAHNNPSAAGRWASTGVAPTEDAAKYVASVRAATY